MNILFLTDNFPPEVNAPASRTFEHCREWVKAGHRVTVITGVPNFPTGRVYPGYVNRPWQIEWTTGIRVIRVWTYITANQGFDRRIIDYTSYMLAAIGAAPFVRRPDIVVATSPLLFTAMAGCAVGWMKRIPFVFELRDIWPESIKAVGAMGDSAVIRFFERVEMFLYRRADLIVSVTHSFKKRLVERGVEAAKIHVVTNGVDLSRFHPMAKDPELERRLGITGKFVAGYIGTHGMAHSLGTLLQAAAILNRNGNEASVHLLFIGAGAEKENVVAQARSMGLNNVTFVPPVPKEEIARYWALLDAAIIHLRRTELFETVIPSKLFEAMGMGVPVLMGVAGEAAGIVEAEKAGLCFTPEDAEMLAEKLRVLKNDPSLRSQLAANAIAAAPKYSRTKLAARMLTLLEKTGTHPPNQRAFSES